MGGPAGGHPPGSRLCLLPTGWPLDLQAGLVPTPDGFMSIWLKRLVSSRFLLTGLLARRLAGWAGLCQGWPLRRALSYPYNHTHLPSLLPHVTRSFSNPPWSHPQCVRMCVAHLSNLRYYSFSSRLESSPPCSQPFPRWTTNSTTIIFTTALPTSANPSTVCHILSVFPLMPPQDIIFLRLNHHQSTGQYNSIPRNLPQNLYFCRGRGTAYIVPCTLSSRL